MKTSITEFNNQTERIKTHLEVLDKFNQLIRNQSNADVDFIKANSTHEKEFTYRSNIISLYGAFEHFIESVIIEYIQSVQEHIASFEEWGEKITKNYFELWKKLHGKLSYQKYSSISENMMVENLYEVVRNKKSGIMPECYLQNGGNYKSTIISEMFNEIGVVNINDSVIKYEPFRSYLIEQNPNSQKLELFQQKELYLHNLDELVERRNEIAHGSSSENTISNEMFQDMLRFIGLYSEAINYFLTDKVREIQWHNNEIETIKIKNVFRNGKVALLNVEDVKKMLYTNNISISVGDSVMVHYRQNECSRFNIERIKEIRVDLKNGEREKIVENVSVVDEIEEIAIEVHNSVKAKQKIKIIPS